MKTKANRSPASVKHHHEVAHIGQMAECPLNNSDFLTWLKLQNQRLEYRLVYCDLVVCLSYILLIFTSLGFQTSVLPNRWFFAVIMLLLLACCFLFIGIHLLQHREADLKVQAKYVMIDWPRYRKKISRWPVKFGLYSFCMLGLACLHYFTYQIQVQMLNTGLWLLTILFFAYGINILITIIRLKENTRIYMLQISRNKK